MARWYAALLGLLALVLLVRLVFEWRRYASGGHVIGRRQMALRVASAVDLLVLLALVLLGARLHFPTAEAAFVYWAICLALAAAAMVMAIVDLKMLRRTHGRRRAESYRRLSVYIRRLERGREGQAPPK
ncbi:MAG: hypothetical protein ACOX9R_12070 [Armatimonadota bacterium]|jgi:small-conductance mechanosensitive channel